ncbi:MAG TPA: serine/threonine-protein kinase [Vicinamibacteria bacterium]|nr:serine/threonine-protein kinase [Vicinamibacteria bacterium]
MTLSDATLARLAEVVEAPDLEGTRYELRGLVGRGGMGTVWRAHDRELGREVALKVTSGPEPRPGLAARLRVEAQVLARLEHPGLVPVHDLGKLPDGRLYYAMKLVRGRRLDQHVSARPDLVGRLRVFERICETVAVAHAQGVIHRDLKPQNVMVGPFGEVLVLDWGVAKVLGDGPPPDAPAAGDDLRPEVALAQEAATLTAAGTVLGTPGYMAPEQARGESDVGIAADVYALGALLAFLAGPHPPPALAAVVGRARASRPQDRYAGAAALAQEVSRYLSGLSVRAYAEGPWEVARRLGRKYRTPLALVFAYLVMRILLALTAGI